ncbi:hypothetical protein EPN42_15965 [bacterium]|nr:MAG: hypothetical protein EPN42_15965 [bacterium]
MAVQNSIDGADRRLANDPALLDKLIQAYSEATFSIDNPEHLRIANALEVRLADQDVLPR